MCDFAAPLTQPLFISDESTVKTWARKQGWPWSYAAWRQYASHDAQPGGSWHRPHGSFPPMRKDQHLSHGSRSLRNWLDFIRESDFILFSSLRSKAGSQSRCACEAQGHQVEGGKLAWERVLGLSLGVRDRLKVRVMVRLRAQGG